ncbi:SIMPL domain-containing protein [Porticoccus sp.]
MRNILLFFLLTFSLAALADDDTNRRLLSTNGHGEVKASADTAIIDLSVRATRKSGEEAKRDVDDRLNRFLDQLKEMKIDQKDVVASSLRVYPRYEHTDGSRHFSGYEAVRTLSVTLHKLEQLTHVIDQALAQRLEGIDNLRYENSKADEHQLNAHQLAIADSKLKASALAKAYGAELGQIVRIDYHSNTPIYSPKTQDAGIESAQLLRSSASRPGTYLPDQLVYQDNIQVVFDLIINP